MTCHMVKGLYNIRELTCALNAFILIFCISENGDCYA